MQDENDRAVAVPSSYGAPGSGPGVNDTVESENVTATRANATDSTADAHDTPEKSA